VFFVQLLVDMLAIPITASFGKIFSFISIGGFDKGSNFITYFFLGFIWTSV
jgi:hypothetical protein